MHRTSPETVKHITSRDNPLFRELKKLAGSARQRRKTGMILLDGVHLLQALLESGHHPQQLIVNQAGLVDAEISALLRKLQEVPLTLFDASLLQEISELKTPTGILALAEQPRPALFAAPPRFCLLLEDIQDPGNLGSMLRSAAAAGCDAVFLSRGCTDAWSPKVLRAGMGGHFAFRRGAGQAMSIHESTDLLAVASTLPGRVHAASLQAKSSLYDCDLRGDVAFAIGNEGAGLSAGLQSHTHPVSIPMPGEVESLNAAAAAAVCLFEAVRQRMRTVVPE